MRRAAGEMGEAVTETVLVVPALLLLIAVVIQFGVWYHAQHVASAAAQEGARAARAEGATVDAGRQAALQFLARSGSDVMEQTTVDVTSDQDRVVVVVSGQAVAVVPGLTLPVHGKATSAAETFRADR